MAIAGLFPLKPLIFRPNSQTRLGSETPTSSQLMSAKAGIYPNQIRVA